jgi:hypothetical protein
MKLANRVFFVTLTIFTALIFTVSAQTLRPESDNRNCAPTVGTGGPVGGPTGLFTVYDGCTLRRGEFTFSVAYSNYDRDPGDVDITEVPISFQIGLSDNLELFFNTDAFRGVKTNSPRNLSSMYLPNADFHKSPAIVLAPVGLLGGQFAGQAVYRPAFNQPFVPYPFVGGGAGHFGYPAGVNPGQSGNPVLGVAPGGASNNFPGIGSIYGSILPGVVLSTVQLPVGPIGGGGDGPGVFTTAPSYLNDAPLLGRVYGSSALSTFTVGAKWRFTGPNNPVGVGIIPFYRFYADSPNNTGGFNQLQGGASPGADRGDIGLIGFVDARVRSWMNISANVGYIYNGDIKADFPGGEVTLLDRGDELLGAIGVDFPVNKYFQPIAEIRALRYVGGRTPNAFENHPVDGLVGARVFIRRWVGFGAAYRHHFNSQDDGSFDEESFTSSVLLPCFTDPTPQVGAGGPNCTPQIITQEFRGVPTGFRTSTDPHGFILQAWIGRRNARQAAVENLFPTINAITVSDSEITLPCPDGTRPAEGLTCPDDMTISVRVDATDPENDPLTYNYTVSGGRIEGTGANVSWDLTGVEPGSYTITTTVDDGCGVCGDPKTETVRVVECPTCVEPPCNCGSIEVSGPPAVVESGETMTFTASISGSDGQEYSYNWSVDRGEIISGQGTSTITVSTDGLEDTTVNASVTATSSAENCSCELDGSDSGVVAPKPQPRLFDEFGNIPNNDVRERLDAYFIQLQNEPDATGYIVNYGSARQITARENLIRNHMRLRNLPSDRIVFVNGGVEPQVRTRLWVVPAGADASTVDE